jgi:beta-glucosidase
MRKERLGSKFSLLSSTLIQTAIFGSLLLLGEKSLAQCPFGDSGVTNADWQRTGAFPPGFFFGVATASHQVEGNDTLSDWAIFEQRADVPKAGQAINHHDLTTLNNDLNLAQSLGINCYRFSIEWSRVEPASGVFDVNEINYYKQVVQLIRTHGMTPMAGLHHFTLPSWLLDPNDPEHKGGWNTTASWSASTTINAFTNYVARMAAELGPTVDHWITFNEPTGQASAGYVAGVWSPGISLFPSNLGNWKDFRNVVNAMITAHRAAYAILKAVDTFDADGDGKPCVVGAVQNVKPIFPATVDADSAQDARDWDYVLHKQFLDAITPVFDTGAFPIPAYALAGRASGMNCWDTNFDYTVDQQSTSESFLDFIGVNYYGPAVSYSGSQSGLAGAIAGDASMGDITMGGLANSILQVNTRQGHPANSFSEEVNSGGPWEVYPEGLLCVLRDLFMRYQLPLMITENGIAEIGSNGLNYAVSKRPAYIVSHLQMLLRAIDEGIPVLGYIHWSLVDNCEWREGYDTRAKFGLYYVHFNSEVIGPLRAGQAFGDVTFKQMDPAITDFTRVETPGAAAYRDICHARGITPDILSTWGSFPSLLGDAFVGGEVYKIYSGIGPTDGIASFDPHFLPGCQILDIDAMLTDENGTPMPQDVNLHQAGRVAYTHMQVFNVRCEIRDSHLGTGDGRASVYWERDSPATPLFFRLFYRVKTCPTDVVWVDFNFSCSCAAGTFNEPWPTLWQGRNHVSPGGTIAIKAGTSVNDCSDPEYDCFPMLLNAPMTITAYGGPAIIGQ